MTTAQRQPQPATPRQLLSEWLLECPFVDTQHLLPADRNSKRLMPKRQPWQRHR
jgi:hypothetical protein